MKHFHNNGVIVEGGHTFIGSRQSVQSIDPQTQVYETVEIDPGQTVTINAECKLSDLASLAVDCTPAPKTAEVTVEIGGGSFDLRRGPLTWTAAGHALCPLTAPISGVKISNRGKEPIKATVLIGQHVKTVDEAPKVAAATAATEPVERTSRRKSQAAA